MQTVWTAAAGTDGPADLRGVVEHVGSGRRRPFRSERDAVVVIRACPAGPPTDDPAAEEIP